jgi:DNA-binding NarL/FixJ family response regulator
MMNKTNVLLADDSEILRRAIRSLLEEQPEIALVGEAKSFAEMIKMTNDLQPEVIVMDLHMKDEMVFEPEVVKSQLSCSETRIVAISMWNDEESKTLAETFGAYTLLDKANLADYLVPAIRQCAGSSKAAD